MKTVIALLMLFTSSAFAGWGDEPTWKELQNDPNIEILWPTYQGVYINDLCVAGEEFRTVRPVKYCAETVVVKRESCRMGEAEYCRELRKGDRVYPGETLKETWGCGSYNVSSDLRLSRAYKSLECVKWDHGNGEAGQQCLKEEFKSRLAPTEHMVPYYDKRSGGESYPNWNYKKYTIPGC